MKLVKRSDCECSSIPGKHRLDIERLSGDLGDTACTFCSLFGSRCFTSAGIRCFALPLKRLQEETPSCHRSWKSLPHKERRVARTAMEHGSAAYLLLQAFPCFRSTSKTVCGMLFPSSHRGQQEGKEHAAITQARGRPLSQPAVWPVGPACRGAARQQPPRRRGKAVVARGPHEAPVPPPVGLCRAQSDAAGPRP